MEKFEQRRRTLYGRQKSHKLSERQQNLMDELLPQLRIDPIVPIEDIAGLFDRSMTSYGLEIGFGGGEHLAAKAKADQDKGFIGCEPFINGMAKLLVAIDEMELENIRLYNDDARHVVNWLPDQCLSEVFILYPDPWPKKRHHKRRLISADFLAGLARIMKPGSTILFASDIGDYVRAALLAFGASPDFHWQATCANDWRLPAGDWPGTRYEAKAIKAGRVPSYLIFKRAPCPGSMQ